MEQRFVEYQNVVMLLAPQDIAGTATASYYLDLKTAQDCTLFVQFGGITTASADQTAGPVVTVEAATAAASAANEVNVEFNYRLSGAIQSNTWAVIATPSRSLASWPLTLIRL